jgi:hypothetical protein
MSGLLTAQVGLTGKIIGTVTDDEGTSLPGVTVEASSPKMQGKSIVITNENGVYRIFALPSGTYTIRYILDGFNTVVRKGIILSTDVVQTVTIDIAMTPGAIEEEITVLGRSPLIDVKSTTKGMTQTKQFFEMLPRGRNFDTLITAVPGVNTEPYLSGISIDGASGAENMYYIDGMDISNMDNGERDQSAAFEFVEEIQIVASGYQAEFGGGMGGVINVITRSGGNAYHGELIGYYSGSALNSKERDTLRLNPLELTEAEYVNYQGLYGKDKVDRYEVGFSLGGYIAKDKLWFFGSFLPVFRNTTRHVEWLPAGSAPESDHEQNQKWWNGQAKITAQFIKNLRVSASFNNNFYKYKGDLPSRAGTDNAAKEWETFGFSYPTWSATAHADLTLGANLLFSAHGGYFYTNNTGQLVKPPTDPIWRFRNPAPFYASTTNINADWPEIPASLQHAANWQNIGYGDAFELKKDARNRMSANVDLTAYMNLAGEHAWKLGVQWVRIEEDIDNTINELYVNIGWDTPFVDTATGAETRGTYGQYAVRGGTSGAYGTFANPSSHRWALYLQDSWTPDFLDDKFTLNVGFRAEKENIPTFSDLPEYQYPPVEFGFFDKLAPRIGVIYDVYGDSNLKIFASYGWYYDVMKLAMATGSYGGFKWISDYYTLDDYDFTKITKSNPGGAGTFIKSYNWRIPSFDSTDPSLKPTVQSELSFGLEKRLSEYIAASVRVVYKHYIRTIEDVGVQTAAGEMYYTANPGFGYTLPQSQGGEFDDKYPATPKAKRDYWGVNLGLDKRFSDNWMAGISYTWSRLRGNFSGLASSDEWGRNSPMVERYWDLWWHMWDRNMDEIVGPLNTDRPHQFKFWSSYTWDFGLTAGLFANALSGIPVTRELHTGLVGYYPDGRLTDGRTPFLFFANVYAEYNLKVTDRYRIQLNINVDNILDVKTARRKYGMMNRGTAQLTDDERLAGWTYDQSASTLTTNARTLSWTPDARYLQEMDFYPPLSVRIGLKLIF